MRPGWYVLLYHNVSWEEPDHVIGLNVTCPPDLFRQHLETLSRIGELVSISEGRRRVEEGSVDRPIFSLWFDDAFLGVRRYALPLLEAHGVAGAVSPISRLVERREMLWRCKLSYLSTVDGMGLLGRRLRRFGYRRGARIKAFTLDRFDERMLKVIDALYRELTTEEQRRHAFSLFDDVEGLRLLAERGWVVANHSAAHYPVGEESYVQAFAEQFEEAEDAYRRWLGTDSSYWVVPFDRPGKRAARLDEAFAGCDEGRTLVLVGDRISDLDAIRDRKIFRVGTASCPGHELPRRIEAAVARA